MAEYGSAAEAVARQRSYPDLEQSILEHGFQARRVASCAPFVWPMDIVLDVGCNSGYLPQYIPQALEVHGCDVNPKLIEVARYRMTSARVAEAERLPWGKRSFDVVNVSAVLEQVFDPRVVLEEAARVSRRYVTGNAPHEDGAWGRARVPSHEWQARTFSHKEILALLEPLGNVLALGTVDAGEPPRPQVWFWCVDVRSRHGAGEGFA